MAKKQAARTRVTKARPVTARRPTPAATRRKAAAAKGPAPTAKRPAAERPAAKRPAAKRPVAARRRSSTSKPQSNPLFAPVTGAERREVGHVQIEVGRAGAARVKRMIYPPGFRWSVDMKPVVGTDLCMHAHVGFLVSGEIHIEYPDGCIVEHKAPQIVAIEPGHDGWVVGSEPVVMVEFDFERDTVNRLGMPDAHTHA